MNILEKKISRERHCTFFEVLDYLGINYAKFYALRLHKRLIPTTKIDRIRYYKVGDVKDVKKLIDAGMI